MNFKVDLALGATVIMPLFSVIATAGQGWYLMEAPLKTFTPGLTQVDRSAPLHQWTHVSGFDSARGCEAALSERGNRATKDLSDPSQRFRRAALESAIEGRCISSDDPRLKP